MAKGCTLRSISPLWFPSDSKGHWPLVWSRDESPAHSSRIVAVTLNRVAR